jgi:hypothetical protein
MSRKSTCLSGIIKPAHSDWFFSVKWAGLIKVHYNSGDEETAVLAGLARFAGNFVHCPTSDRNSISRSPAIP